MFARLDYDRRAVWVRVHVKPVAGLATCLARERPGGDTPGRVAGADEKREKDFVVVMISIFIVMIIIIITNTIVVVSICIMITVGYCNNIKYCYNC